MKSLRRDKLVSFLNEELGLSEFPKDDSINGLQVEGRESVRKIGVAVDACEYVFEAAADSGVDFLIVHHGLIWGGIRAMTGCLKTRIKMLLEADISLYACHLPLDWHPLHGNNIQILNLLRLSKAGEFGEYHGRRIGYWGRTKKETSLSDFVTLADRKLNTDSIAMDFGRKVRNVGVVSGGGWSALYDAERFDIDTFLTGEPSHSAYTLAEEMKVNLIFSGHYATETVGVMAVGRLLHKKFGLGTVFIDHPTGL
ncbi:MAG: Nif3-like dinuclear metal center hexameric protein [Nitrospirae bacterium]|nr:Nif3-like dinuclear metal center hexameric protein [Nitrospirota bacterium]